MKQSDAAKAQIEGLRRHYIEKGRLEASRNLTAAIREAARLIVAGKGRAAPGPYPELAAPGEAWIRAGRHWFVYSTAKPHEIIAMFYEEADIPRRR